MVAAVRVSQGINVPIEIRHLSPKFPPKCQIKKKRIKKEVKNGKRMHRNAFLCVQMFMNTTQTSFYKLLLVLLLDVSVQKPFVEIASNGIVHEPLLSLRLVSRLVAKDGVVVPSSF